MKNWRIYYYYRFSHIKHKLIKADSVEQAIKKSRLKNIISLIEE